MTPTNPKTLPKHAKRTVLQLAVLGCGLAAANPHPGHAAGPWTEKVVAYTQEEAARTSDEYAAAWNYYKNRGYAPVGLGAVEKSGQPVRYQGLWAKDPGILDWTSKRNLTDAQYEEAWEDLVGAGYRVVDLDAHASGNSPRFNAIFVRESPSKPFVSHRSLTLAQLDAKVVEYRALGYRPIKLNGYRVGSAQRYAGVWVKDALGSDAILRRDLTGDQYGSAWTTYKNAGYRPIDVAAYPTASGLRYGGIWLRVANQPDWVSLRDKTLAELDTQRLALKKVNYTMVDLDAYYVGSSLRFSGVWVRTQPKNLLRSNVSLSGSSLISSLQSAIDSYTTLGGDNRKGNLGFYVEDLTTGHWVAYNPHEPFYLASSAKTFIASKVVDMPELPEGALYTLRTGDWRGENRGFTAADIGKNFSIATYLDHMIDNSDSVSTDRLFDLAEHFDGALTVNKHLRDDADMLNVGEITNICTLDKRIFAAKDSCVWSVPCNSFENWYRGDSLSMSSAADVACFNDIDDSPVSGEFAYDAYYHTLANTVTPAEAGRFFRQLADHQLHDVFDEASLVRELDKNGGYSNFTGTYFDAWGGKDGGKYKVKTWIGLTWDWDNAAGDYTSLTHQFAIAVFTEDWTTDDTTGDNLAANIIQTVVDKTIPFLVAKR
jgi:hypothetical protein